MTREHYQKAIADEKHQKLAWFVKTLSLMLPISHIDTNDWECPTPAVYVHGRDNMFKMSRYRRCACVDVVKAIKFWNRH